MSKKVWIIGTIAFLILLAGIISITDPPKKNLGDESTVSWVEAIRILNSGEVELVSQTHSLEVTLLLEDGRIIQTKEPDIDDIFEEIEMCGAPCKDIVLITE